jgi:hypothetical protein
MMSGTAFDVLMSQMVPIIHIMLIIAFILGVVVALFSVDGTAFLLPLMAVVWIIMLPLMTGMFLAPGSETPAALSDVPDTDWSAVWSVLGWIGFGVSIPLTCFVLWRLSVWTRRGFTWFVSPPPRWLCRWLKRPIPPVIRPLQVAPYSVDRPVLIVLDDPIFAQIDHAIEAADRALREDRLS